MDHFVGIDVSLESCAVCVVNQSGAVVREAKVVCEPEPLITLRATPLAYSTLGITDAPDEIPPTEAPVVPVQRRKGSKQETLIAMLRAEGGATIEEIMAANDWAAHTIRGAMSGALKKRLGLTISSEKVDGRGRVYAIRD